MDLVEANLQNIANQRSKAQQLNEQIALLRDKNDKTHKRKVYIGAALLVLVCVVIIALTASKVIPVSEGGAIGIYVGFGLTIVSVATVMFTKTGHTGKHKSAAPIS